MYFVGLYSKYLVKPAITFSGFQSDQLAVVFHVSCALLCGSDQWALSVQAGLVLR